MSNRRPKCIYCKELMWFRRYTLDANAIRHLDHSCGWVVQWVCDCGARSPWQDLGDELSANDALKKLEDRICFHHPNIE